jgi:arsenate reductase
MVGDPRLPLVQDERQLADTEFLPQKKQDDPQTGGIGKGFKNPDGVFHIISTYEHIFIYYSRCLVKQPDCTCLAKRAKIGFRPMTDKKRVLFICTHNAARSQMAEAFLKALFGDRYEAYSAGTSPTEVNPYAIKAMQEVGIDISGHRSKGVEEFLGQRFDQIVTVCDNAKEACPFFPDGANHIHKSFQDPSMCKGSEQEILDCVRRIRDEIKDWIIQSF